MFLNHYASLKTKVAYRLLAVSFFALVLMTSATALINHVAFSEVVSRKRNDIGAHFRAQLAATIQNLEKEALRTKTLIELTGYLEDRTSRWEKLRGYLFAQSGFPQFSHAVITNMEGAELFQFGPNSEKIPAAFRFSGTGAQDVIQIMGGSYHVFRLPIWMGEDGMGYLLLFKPLDNASLLELSNPEVDLYFTWQGRPFASSLGGAGIEAFPRIAAQSAVADSYYELLSIPYPVFAADTPGAVGPTLVVRMQVRRPFSVLASAGINAIMFVAFFGALWFSLGAWLSGTVQRIIQLGQATSRFAEGRKVTPELETVLAAVERGRDELGMLGGSLRATMTKIEEADLVLQNVNNELEIRRGEADLANKAKSDFLANMSHELRTPLNAIIGFSDLMLRGMSGPLAETQREHLHDINASGKHLLSVINDILDVSKLEAGTIQFEPEEYDLTELVESSLTVFREKVLIHGIELRRDVEKTEVALFGDRRILKQVVYNLVSNAIKFTPDGGSVSVRTRGFKGNGDDHAEISVTDTGIGMTTEEQAQLFQPFKQLGHHLTKRHEGTGLGLALCKKFVELHNGSIAVESASGRGSTFTVRLPLAKAQS
jgi:signal transduction histidine kinase